MSDVSGPFTLEQLDQFGNLDSLAFSLDSSVWNTATIFSTSATLNSSTSTTLSVLRERTASGSITASASTSFVGTIVFTISSSVSSSATVSSNAIRVQFIDSSVNALASVSALAGVVFETDATLESTTSVLCDAVGEFSFVVVLPSIITDPQPNAIVSCETYLVGEEWGDVTIDSDTWSDVSIGSGIWTETEKGNETWH